MSALTKKSARNTNKKSAEKPFKRALRPAIKRKTAVSRGASSKKADSSSKRAPVKLGKRQASTKRQRNVPARSASASHLTSATKHEKARQLGAKVSGGQLPAKRSAVGTSAKRATHVATRFRTGSVAKKIKFSAKRTAPNRRNKYDAQVRAKAKPTPTPNRKSREVDRLKRLRLKERDAAAKLRAKEKLRAQKKREAAAKQRERERARKQRSLSALRTAREKETQRRERAESKQKLVREREAKRLAALAAREQERQHISKEREAARRAKEEQRQREKAEKDAEREAARRQKEEERAKREAEREAYRRAKEAERERIRATKEAQKRALEGRIAEANRNANKLGGGRSSTTRIYSPRAIPDQSGTTRRVADASVTTTAHLSTLGIQTPEADQGAIAHGAASIVDDVPRLSPPPERPLPTAESVEERYRIIEERLKEAPSDFRNNYQETLDMSWIYHDSALEGVVYTFQELRAAIDRDPSVLADSSLQPVVEEVRRHKTAIDLVRELGEKKRAPISVDVIRKIYLTLHPEEGDIKPVKYRRDIPQHRLYFHEYAHPEKIQHKVRQIVNWLNGPEPKKLKSPIRVASRAHYELLRVFPFQTDSGKVARLFMNLLLMRAGHPPAIIHSTERQRYYESLRGSLPSLIQMVTESTLNALVSIEKLLDEHDMKAKT